MPLAGNKHRPKHLYIYGIVVALIFTLAGTGIFLLYHKPAPVQVNVSGSNAELGTGYGKALRFRMALLARVYLKRIVCSGDSLLFEQRRTKALENLKHWAPAYAEELQTVSRASGVEIGALAYANSFLDLGHARAGCRSAVVDSGESFLHAHNLDWDTLGGLGRWTTCIVRRQPADGRLATVSVGFPGIIGALDIINEKGLALSFNQLGMSKGNVTEPVFIMIRRVAETCDSFDQARARIHDAPPGMPFIITVSDTKARKGAVFERERDQIVERPLANGRVAACNVSQGTNAIFTRLDKILAESHVLGVQELQNTMSHEGVLLSCNIYSVIFDYQHNQLLLASGTIPAATEGYRAFPLFP